MYSHKMQYRIKASGHAQLLWEAGRATPAMCKLFNPLKGFKHVISNIVTHLNNNNM